MAYSVVAAGILGSRDFTGENMYNRLRVASPKAVKRGAITFTFDNYPSAADYGRYIVNASVMSQTGKSATTVQLRGFGPDGFTLTIVRGTTPLTITEIRKLQFMIEVTRF